MQIDYMSDVHVYPLLVCLYSLEVQNETSQSYKTKRIPSASLKDSFLRM